MGFFGRAVGGFAAALGLGTIWRPKWFAFAGEAWTPQKGDIVTIKDAPERYLIVADTGNLARLLPLREYPRFNRHELMYATKDVLLRHAALPILPCDWPRGLA